MMQERHRPRELHKIIMPKTAAERALVSLGSLGFGGIGTIAGPVGTLIGIPVGAAVATGVNIIARINQRSA